MGRSSTRSHRAGEDGGLQGQQRQESTASACMVQPAQSIKTELLAAGLLKGFRTLLNAELAKTIAEKAYEIFTAPEK